MKAIVKFNTLFIVSNYDMKTINKVNKFRHEALNLYKGEGDKKDLVFSVTTGLEAYYSKNGFQFKADTIAGDPHAVMAVQIPEWLEDKDAIQAWIREEIGMGIVYANEVEKQIETALVEIAVDEATMNASVTFDEEVPVSDEVVDGE